jgi:two-component system phosphate regulon response regulator PhoB
LVDAVYFLQQIELGEWFVDRERATSTRSYRFRLGRETIQLDLVEYRILNVLASRPYHAFPRKRLIEAVSTELEPVTEETLDDFIASLRDKLGFFRDYVQTVPYIGYRFKA